jgi:predicted nucleic acid-binding protein
MDYISSDTNVWIDFMKIDKLDLPFKLQYVYLMENSTISEELLVPEGLNARLVKLGLKGTEMSFEEYILAEKFNSKYKRLSKHDCVALAIAKNREIILLTGDLNLRKAAQAEKVKIMGTLKILDELIGGEYISKDEYDDCLRGLSQFNGGVIRLPQEEIDKRLNGKGDG